MNFGVDKVRAAVVGIDLHRGHLDMAVATMPATPEVADRVVAANRRLFDWARSQGLPVIHCITQYRDAASTPSGARAPKTRTTRART